MSDRIEKQIVLRAPRARVWRAIADKGEFGQWFRVQFPPGTFAAGERVSGRILHPGYEHMTMDVEVVEVSPERRLSYRWHPYAIDSEADSSSEPTTLVAFTLEEVAGGTKLSIVESGFDAIPASRRATAFEMNDRGWTGQSEKIRKYVEAHA